MSKNTKTLSAGRPSARASKALTLASLSTETATKRVNFDIPANQHQRLKVYAAEHGKSIRELLSEQVAKLVG
jgi:hypothetical protein